MGGLAPALRGSVHVPPTAGRWNHSPPSRRRTMIRQLLAVFCAVLLFAAPAVAAGYDDSGYWALADRMEQRLDGFWDPDRGYFAFGSGGVESDGQLDDAAHLQRRRHQRPSRPGPQRRTRAGHRRQARRAVRRPVRQHARSRPVARSGLGELDARPRHPAPRLRRRGRRRSRLRLPRPRRSAALAARPSSASATPSTAPPTAPSGATRRSG